MLQRNAASRRLLSHKRTVAVSNPTLYSAVSPSRTLQTRSCMVSPKPIREGFLAPGPATDHLVHTVRKPEGISKEQLIAIAQENNRKKGKDPNAGLELFLPAPLPVKSYGSVIEVHREPGFRVYQERRSLKNAKSLSLLSDPSLSYLDKLPATPSQRWTAAGKGVSRQATPGGPTMHEVMEYERRVTAQISATAKRLNQKCIFSKAINHVRASTMAAVKISAKHRQRVLSHVPSLQAVSTVNSGFDIEGLESQGQLRANLEDRLVDKLAAAEIETIKMIEREAAYPKMSTEQIREKLGRLRHNAESHYSPLQSVRFMEVLHFPVHKM